MQLLSLLQVVPHYSFFPNPVQRRHSR